MKRIKHIKLIALTILSVLFFTNPNATFAQRGYNDYQSDVSFQMFYDELAPYGDWVNDREHGYMWIPDVGPNFQPYSTNGYWTMTEYGNTWVSNYSWGWAPFHYGRWEYNNNYGWAWTPDYEWGPAWVNWRQGSGYYGWAPLGINISINLPMNLWVFVGSSNIYSNRLDRYYVHPRNYNNFYNKTTIINNTIIVNNRNYYGGPRRSDIERSTGKRVSVRNINNSGRAGTSRVTKNSIDMYRPNIDRNSRTDARPGRIADASSRTRNNNSSLQNRNDKVISGRDNMTTTRGNRELYIDNKGNATVRSGSNNSTTTRNNDRAANRNQNSSNVTGSSRTRDNSNATINNSSNTGNARTETNSSSVRTDRTRGNTSSSKQEEIRKSGQPVQGQATRSSRNYADTTGQKRTTSESTIDNRS
ncbi:DUF6600 domain-containing protein [Sphingobacterium sp. SG20118]|uniref:DUF6600 domain-containing protein n=1 Tax=Sphingobacterium sp. SG20118 TaxID=3367156 RepID=UPI0037DFBE5A